MAKHKGKLVKNKKSKNKIITLLYVNILLTISVGVVLLKPYWIHLF